MNDALRKVIKRLHYPLEITLTCVRWYVAYPLSLRHIEEMMLERGVVVDHATVHRWSLKIVPVLAKIYRRRKRSVGKSWRMDETYSAPRPGWSGEHMAGMQKRKEEWNECLALCCEGA
jgi:putative transposase